MCTQCSLQNEVERSVSYPHVHLRMRWTEVEVSSREHHKHASFVLFVCFLILLPAAMQFFCIHPEQNHLEPVTLSLRPPSHNLSKRIVCSFPTSLPTATVKAAEKATRFTDAACDEMTRGAEGWRWETQKSASPSSSSSSWLPWAAGRCMAQTNPRPLCQLGR